MTDSKVCTKCRVDKPLEEFYVAKKGRLGRFAHCKVCHSQYRTNNLERCKVRDRSAHLRRTYGLDAQGFDSLLASQSGGCGICGKLKAKMCVDHCHQTGTIRGILCGACNTAIGNLGDNVEGVTRALYYLQKSLNA
jgi:hypothetical protein